MILAPVVLFVYNRFWHTQKTIETLKKNLLAHKSKLFIFSDGPKDELDKRKVDSVRSYLRTIDGFKEIYIKESTTNQGLANSIINGVTEIITQYKKVIVMEDDLESSQGFLNFMNEALEYYEEDHKIFSVSGYSFPIEIPENYIEDVYILTRASTWGWGTWKDRWLKVDWETKNFGKFLRNSTLQKEFNKSGEDLTPMLKAQLEGYIDSWGIRWTYAHFDYKAFCIYPVVPLIKNIGADKSGIHTSKTNKFDIELKEDNPIPKLVKDLSLNSIIQNRLKKFLKLSIQRKIINILKFNFLFMKKYI